MRIPHKKASRSGLREDRDTSLQRSWLAFWSLIVPIHVVGHPRRPMVNGCLTVCQGLGPPVVYLLVPRVMSCPAVWLIPGGLRFHPNIDLDSSCSHLLAFFCQHYLFIHSICVFVNNYLHLPSHNSDLTCHKNRLHVLLTPERTLWDLRGTVVFLCEDRVCPHLFLILAGLEARQGPSVKMENPVKTPPALAFKVSLGGLSCWWSNQSHCIRLDICLSSEGLIQGPLTLVTGKPTDPTAAREAGRSQSKDRGSLGTLAWLVVSPAPQKWGCLKEMTRSQPHQRDI